MSIIFDRKQAAIYILKKDGAIVYVGKSINVITRISGHRWKDYDQVEIIPTSLDKLDFEERKLLLLHRPKLNLVIAHPERIMVLKRGKFVSMKSNQVPKSQPSELAKCAIRIKCK